MCITHSYFINAIIAMQAAKREADEKRRQEAKKAAAAAEKLANAPVKPHELKRVLKGICLVLSRTAMRIHREVCFRNLRSMYP
jgi:hypothetical protein